MKPRYFLPVPLTGAHGILGESLWKTTSVLTSLLGEISEEQVNKDLELVATKASSD